MDSQSPTLRAEIVTTGTEILLGEIVDTNAAWIAQQLRDSGINLFYKTTIGDNERRVQEVIETCLSRSNAIIVTGGLGPTADDITRQAIAAATGSPLILHEGALKTLRERFERFGVPMTDNNRQQALIPDGAILIENPVGTAPGFIVETEAGSVIALPGVPREMKRLMTDTVLPYLRALNGHSGVIRRRVLRTIGIGESSIDNNIRDLMQSANPTVGLAAHMGQADVRITGRAENEAGVEAMLDELEAEIRARIGEFIYSDVPNETFVDVVARGLSGIDATVALIESNTDGNVAARLDAAPGDTPVTARWKVANLPAGLQPHLQQSFGAEPARRLAEGARELSGTTYALAILASDGADEGIYGDRPGESWYALAGPDKTDVLHLRFGGRDEYTLARTGNAALQMLWRDIRQRL